jgi:hypothetical protein
VADETGESTTRHCRSCGGQLRPGVRFCQECGQVVAPRGGVGAATPTMSSLVAREPERTVAAREASARPSHRPYSSSLRPDRGPVQGRRVITVVAALATATAIVLVFLLAHPFRRAEAAARTAPPRHSVAASTPAVTSSPVPSATASSTAASSTEQQAATSLAALLSQSGSDRQGVNEAFNDVSQCGPDLATDVQTFSAAAASRQQLLQELNQISGLSTLPSAMVSDLTSAWQVSATVDNDYVMWAQDQEANGCSTSASGTRWLSNTT